MRDLAKLKRQLATFIDKSEYYTTEKEGRMLNEIMDLICENEKMEKLKEDFSFFYNFRSESRLYKIWFRMNQRCYVASTTCYKNYGGRGIRVCDEWRGKIGFYNFYIWANMNGYDDSLTIDRIDVNGNYEPDNCRWITISEQQKNKRYAGKYYNVNGENKTLEECSQISGVCKGTLTTRVRSGMTMEEAMKMKKFERYKNVILNHSGDE